jgi:hypothetical protein
VGVVTVLTTRRPFPSDTADRLADFTELVATAVGNAESRAELAASRARIVAEVTVKTRVNSLTRKLGVAAARKPGPPSTGTCSPHAPGGAKSPPGVRKSPLREM